jgi:hypothetical protein
MARFKVWLDREVIGDYELDNQQIRVGRHPQAEIFLPHESVSRLHALITKQAGTFSIEDPGGTNGLFVNGRQVVGSMPLATGDLVELARYLITFVAEGADDLSVEQLVDRMEAAADQAPRSAPVLPTSSEQSDQTFRLTREQVMVQRLQNRASQGAHLKWTSPTGEQTMVPLANRSIDIGAGEECRIMIPSGLGTARVCATVELRGRDWILVVAGRWTRVSAGGQRIREEHLLEDADTFYVGDTPFIFHAALKT